MNLKPIGLLPLALLFSCATTENKVTIKTIPVEYVKTQKDDSVVDDYHGTKVADPYRWLEDDNAADTKEWVTAQNKTTFGYLEQIPFREEIKNRLTEVWNYERVSVPFKEGASTYFYKNDGLQNQSLLYRLDKDGKEEVVLDPNKFSEDGTSSLGGTSFSKDGKYMAYQVSEGGSDWRKVKVKNLESGKDLNDEVEWVKFSAISWAGDGFYYSRYPKPTAADELSGRNVNHKLYYHKLGTSQSADQLIHEDTSQPNHGVFGGTTDDERFLTLGIWESTSGNALHFYDLEGDKKKQTIYKDIAYDFNLVGNLDDQLLIMTNFEADNNRLIQVDSKQPDQSNWKDLIPQSGDKMSGANIIGDKLFVQYIHNASSLIKVFDQKGNFIQDLELPGIGTVGSLSGKANDNQAFYSFTSFTRPTSIYELDVTSLKSTLHKAPKSAFNPDDFMTEQVWYSSKDGTKIPMFLTFKKGIKKTGDNPTLLYGYGGFDISILPSFQVKRTVLLENGGIFAVANIRGGGEFGKQWHLAGTKERKQNVFDDFQAAAEFLITENYTSSAHLAIEGRSNGGLLVGACMTQRPDLFAVAFPGVGVLDMLRYDKFTIGRAWGGDYGLSEESEDFNYLYAYSPYHNLAAEDYPATMITTADHDDRVVPAHSFKFAARLQEMHTGETPVLIRIETSAGHGAGKPVSKQIEEAADETAFLFYNVGKSLQQ